MRTARLFEAAGIASFPERSTWDAEVVDIVATMVHRWGLTVGDAHSGGISATVLDVVRPDGSPAVLKVGYPHEEAIAEAVALDALPRDCAPAVLAQDAWTWSMLLERVDPGQSLLDEALAPRAALVAGAELLSRLSATRPVAGIPLLADVVTAQRRVARSRVDAQRDVLQSVGALDLVPSALSDVDALVRSGMSSAFVHGDFNPGNILRSRDGWVAIDPKPMIGDPAFDLWPLVVQLGTPFGGPDPVSSLGEAVGVAARTAGCDPVRATRWAAVRSALAVTWYVHAGSLDVAAREADELRVWARLSERMTTGPVG
ncbi:aminoglycoside phosphotransferase family protein [Marisediminicola sp. LYQ134]|uniref:aminoglycoside phosphotransferase family protein n=1 Tax=unclassified Marisediminicola TaxID=2618316 RepID=UPI003983B866